MNKKPDLSGNNDLKYIGGQLGFEGKEAYNLLRTNLLFAVKRTDRTARVIGVTSSVHGEGKSLTSLNLAHSLAESGRRVLLIECDMRLPSLRKKLGQKKLAGLSNLLAGMDEDGDFIYHNTMINGMDMIFAGKTPPNPSELLASPAFGKLIDKVGDYYSFIILDLPPVCEVSDAMIVSKHTDGMIMVVRQDYSRSTDLDYAMRQLKYVDAKILGFVFNGSESKHKRYKYKYGKSYSKS